MSVLERLVTELEQDTALDEPLRIRERLDALDRLDRAGLTAWSSAAEVSQEESSLPARVRAVHARLEGTNRTLFRAIRKAIQRGAGAEILLRSIREQTGDCDVSGEGYDWLDELVSGVLELDDPEVQDVRHGEMVFYQPTPARHIFELLNRVQLTEEDVLIDLGSGLGHVPLLASICSNALCVGIEIEPAYSASARRCARLLNLSRTEFLDLDARAADLSRGTIFYLYTPFRGTILRSVLDALKQQAQQRRIRVCTFGSCVATVAQQPWLTTAGEPVADRVVVFQSK